uniref:Pentatricopeptide repeat domain 2 n=1 Tax=Apteryx owenii TaxID=8824 RepID=A0A8B9PJ16_APTOW
MKKQGIPFNKETYLLAFAICYKLDSLESCKISAKLLEEAQLKVKESKHRDHCLHLLTCNSMSFTEENPVLSAKLGDIYTRLQASGQITTCTLDDMLFQVPSSEKNRAKLLKQKQLGYQAAKPLHSNLLLE